MMAYDEKSKAYTLAYMKENLKRVPLDLPYDFYGEVYVHAHERGESINGFIKRAIRTTIEFDNGGGEQKDKNSSFREALKKYVNEQDKIDGADLE